LIYITFIILLLQHNNKLVSVKYYADFYESIKYNDFKNDR